VPRFWGAYAASRVGDRVSRSPTFSPNLLELESNGFGEAATCTRAACASQNRSRPIPLELPLVGPCDHSKINVFQSLRLGSRVKIVFHCLGPRARDSRKKTGILCGVEQRSC
jgi:hypothetical protein